MCVCVHVSESSPDGDTYAISNSLDGPKRKERETELEKGARGILLIGSISFH